MTGQQEPELKARWVFLLAAAAVVALFWVAVGVASLFGAKEGTTPDWVAAIATLAAFGAAVIAGWYAHRALTVEQARDRARDEQRTRAQAELVAAWVSTEYRLIAVGGVGTGFADAPCLMVRNASDLPVLNFRAVLSARKHVNGGQETSWIGRIDLPIVPPGTETEKHPAPVDVVLAHAAVVGAANGATVVVTCGVIFTDVGGRHWIRDDNGQLRVADPVLVPRRDAEMPV